MDERFTCFMPNCLQICSYIIEKILENRQKRLNLSTPKVKFNANFWPQNAQAKRAREKLELFDIVFTFIVFLDENWTFFKQKFMSAYDITGSLRTAYRTLCVLRTV